MGAAESYDDLVGHGLVPSDLWGMRKARTLATIEARFESGTKHLGTYADEGTEWPVWEDEFTSAKLFEDSGAAFMYAAEWGLGVCEVVEWNLTEVRREKVIA